MAEKKISVAGIAGHIQTVLDAVKALAPIASTIGGPVVANVATIAIAAIGVVENVLERAENAKVALSTQDEEKLRQMLSELQAANDRLAGKISES